MAFKLEYSITSETFDESEIEMLNVIANTDYPAEPVTINLDGNKFITSTDDEGIGKCSTSDVRDYHVVVKVHGETFEDDINIEN